MNDWFCQSKSRDFPKLVELDLVCSSIVLVYKLDLVSTSQILDAKSVADAHKILIHINAVNEDVRESEFG